MRHSELVLLALLGAGGPAPAYQLIRRIQAMRISRWAKVATSTLYAVLRRLEREGLLHGANAPGEQSKLRRVYRITARGARRLERMIDDGIEKPAPVYSDLLVAAVFACSAGREAQMEKAEEAATSFVSNIERALHQRELSPIGRVILRFHQRVAEAQRDAVRELARIDKFPVHHPTAESPLAL